MKLSFVIAAAFAAFVSTWNTAASEDRSPCTLLTAAEAEAVLGPLVGPPFRANGAMPDVTGGECRYEAANFRSIALRVEWSHGGDSFGAMNMTQGVINDGGLKGVVKLSDGSEVAGAWDEARVFMCCEFYALRGEQLVVVDISGSRATVAQAATLADAAVKRLDQPITLDEAAGLAAATGRESLRPQRRPACQLLARSDAEAIIGKPLRADPTGDDNSRTYAWSLDDAGSDYELKLVVKWRGGLSEFRTTQAMIGQGLDFMKSQGVDLAKDAQPAGPFDEEASSMIAEMAVKKDVLFSIENGGAMSDVARALIAKAAGNL